MKRNFAGDTLIEVLFAFAILSLVISVMFSGAMGSYKSAMAAQDRTTALFVAQYQADGLKTYRDSLDWKGAGYSFLDGDSLNSPPRLTALRNYTSTFCMSIPTASTPSWSIKTTDSDCNSIASGLAPALSSPKIRITPQALSADEQSQFFVIEVSWTARNSGQQEKVTNTILLTQQR